MGLRLNKHISLGKHLRLNISKSGGVGVSGGIRGARVSYNPKTGVRRSVGIPGTGIYYSDQNKIKSNKNIYAQKENKIQNFTDNIAEKISKYRECPIDNKEDKIKFPSIMWIEVVIIVGLVIATIFFIPMAVFALISLIVMLFTVLFNKQIKAQTQQYKAIKAYTFSDNIECIRRCKQSLKYMNCDSTRRLLELAENEME